MPFSKQKHIPHEIFMFVSTDESVHWNASHQMTLPESPLPSNITLPAKTTNIIITFMSIRLLWILPYVKQVEELTAALEVSKTSLNESESKVVDLEAKVTTFESAKDAAEEDATKEDTDKIRSKI